MVEPLVLPPSGGGDQTAVFRFRQLPALLPKGLPLDSQLLYVAVLRPKEQQICIHGRELVVDGPCAALLLQVLPIGQELLFGEGLSRQKLPQVLRLSHVLLDCGGRLFIFQQELPERADGLLGDADLFHLDSSNSARAETGIFCKHTQNCAGYVPHMEKFSKSAEPGTKGQPAERSPRAAA